MPEIVIVDEIGTEAEALACRTIAERGVQLIGTAHGVTLENLIKNPTLTDLVGGIQSVTLGMPFLKPISGSSSTIDIIAYTRCLKTEIADQSIYCRSVTAKSCKTYN